MKTIKSLSLMLIIGSFMIAMHAGCLSILDGQPDIEGTVSSMNGEGFLVEEDPHQESGSSKAKVTVTSATRVFYQEGSAQTRAGVDDISVGDQVRVWFTGPVLESYPVQATARAIAIVVNE